MLVAAYALADALILLLIVVWSLFVYWLGYREGCRSSEPRPPRNEDTP